MRSLACVVAVGAMLLSGCADQPRLTGPEAALQQQLDSAVGPDATVSFRSLAEGWETSTLVCRGAEEADLGSLGEIVNDLATLDSPGFLALLMFMDAEGEVVAASNMRQNIYHAISFDPCPADRISDVIYLEPDGEFLFRYSTEQNLWVAVSVTSVGSESPR